MEPEDVQRVEWALIEDTDIVQGGGYVTELGSKVLNGEYIDIFNSEFTREILRIDDDNLQSGEDNLDVQKFLLDAVERWFKAKNGLLEQEFQVLALGIACLHAFVQVNYTGPFLPFDAVALLPPSLRSHLNINSAILDGLAIDGANPYHLMPQAYLLLIATVLLDRPSQLVTAPWWRARAHFLHQRVLSDPASSLHD